MGDASLILLPGEEGMSEMEMLKELRPIAAIVAGQGQALFGDRACCRTSASRWMEL